MLLLMDQYKALFHILQLSGELSKDISLYYHIGHLFGYSGEELMLLLLYSCFSYKLAFYAILVGKYLSMLSFTLFLIHLHQHMLTLGLDSYYFQVLSCLQFLQILWPENSLHASGHLDTPRDKPFDATR